MRGSEHDAAFLVLVYPRVVNGQLDRARLAASRYDERGTLEEPPIFFNRVF